MNLGKTTIDGVTFYTAKPDWEVLGYSLEKNTEIIDWCLQNFSDKRRAPCLDIFLRYPDHWFMDGERFYTLDEHQLMLFSLSWP